MPDDMYDEADSSLAGSESESAASDTKDKKSDETEDQLALVPKHFFKDEPKPGDRETVEVIEVYEGEVSIKCVYGEKEEEKEEPESEMAAPSESEDSMMM
jgi:hypothetical protein